MSAETEEIKEVKKEVKEEVKEDKMDAGMKKTVKLLTDAAGGDQSVGKWVDDGAGGLRFWYPSDWIKVDFMRHLYGGEMVDDENKYARKWIRQPFLWEFRQQPHWRTFYNNKGLTKEACEAWALIRRVKYLVETLCGGDYSKAVVFDICCGKGYLGATLAGMHRDLNVRMLDKNKHIKFSYLADLPNATATIGDIMKGTFLVDWVNREMAKLPQGTVGIIVGIHLCGLLSEALINAFIKCEGLKGMALSPCCLANHKICDATNKARPLLASIDNYIYWNLHLLFMIPKEYRKSLKEDTYMNTKKDRVLLATKTPRLIQSYSDE